MILNLFNRSYIQKIFLRKISWFKAMNNGKVRELHLWSEVSVQAGCYDFCEKKTQKRVFGWTWFFTNAHNCGIIANLVFPYICIFLVYLYDVSKYIISKYIISGCNRTTFQGCNFHWPSSFLMAQLQRSWGEFVKNPNNNIPLIYYFAHLLIFCFLSCFRSDRKTRQY